MALFNITLSSATTSAVFELPPTAQNWMGIGGISLLVNFSGGGPAVATASVQVSKDLNVKSTNTVLSAAARWNNHDILYNLTTDKNSSIVYPVGFIRLSLTSYTSGSVSLQICYPSRV